MVISSEFRLRQYTDDDHREYEPHFNNFHLGTHIIEIQITFKVTQLECISQ